MGLEVIYDPGQSQVILTREETLSLISESQSMLEVTSYIHH